MSNLGLKEAASATLVDWFLQSVDLVIVLVNYYQDYGQSPECTVVEWVHKLTGPPDAPESKIRHPRISFEIDGVEVSEKQFFHVLIRHSNWHSEESHSFN